MCRRYRFLLFLMLLWLPVKGVLSAAMPFPPMAVQSAGTEVAHCYMQTMPELGEVAPLSQTGHDAGGHGGYGQSITCHGLCAVFLATDFVFPLTADLVDAPPFSRVAFHSHIPEFPDRPPVL